MNSTNLAPAPAANPFGGSPGGEATDAMWVILATFIIFTMQSGFGLLESGKCFKYSKIAFSIMKPLSHKPRFRHPYNSTFLSEIL